MFKGMTNKGTLVMMLGAGWEEGSWYKLYVEYYSCYTIHAGEKWKVTSKNKMKRLGERALTI